MDHEQPFRGTRSARVNRKRQALYLARAIDDQAKRTLGIVLEQQHDRLLERGIFEDLTGNQEGTSEKRHDTGPRGDWAVDRQGQEFISPAFLYGIMLPRCPAMKSRGYDYLRASGQDRENLACAESQS